MSDEFILRAKNLADSTRALSKFRKEARKVAEAQILNQLAAIYLNRRAHTLERVAATMRMTKSHAEDLLLGQADTERPGCDE